ncbi:MAG: 16S rRNA (adenine(1518)-N(6)/adenine(1519)-N(6))-dimethyltransferase RsmA [Armatimonadota bacterium]|nr:16S rRNA (adenine(1518)-N(6)/adenine(1519)-N(6))-dimethyltransferase RsmA [Armatimonadota bacterium]MDR7443656.1 16S rRNA (adenine(1518)-N(6)/adenine(1519)-N(6))-dimethyltransferase RsmA [Armatimonadota bacterium]MDR7570405.1 16S rRNA (adenine(1518)-N(6)/adenine(1519)-N(6))-dimethyltransferase RsmA [Armatimonadota bacterium]MDR7613814.1 16S rRNA (adenine(1518)-N(6)/adenine(1519)-N(6))-dimethyltransferase RsmA [Armatimonadota bacterium]
MRRALRTALRRHQLRPKRRLGQHFLVDPRVLERIVALAELGPEDAVLEVGAGMGILTEQLARRAGWVVAVEVDPALLPALEERVSGFPNVQIVQGDILALDLRALFPPGFVRKVVSNLPYQIASPLTVRLLQEVPELERLVLMVQREVAERMAACPGTKEYGLLSLLVQYRARVEIALRIPPRAFLPPPKVHSAVVVLRPHPSPAPVDEALLFRVVRAAFAHRRKQLRNALRILELPPEVLVAAAQDARVALHRRGETLSLQEFVALAEALARFGHSTPEAGNSGSP